MPRGYKTPVAPEVREAQFWARVDASGDCWEWTGSKTSYGYGIVIRNWRRTGAHREAYRLLVGPIPEGLTIDHLCRNHSCVNPDHLEPVTRAENVRRGIPAGYWGKQPRCTKGHPYTPDNIYHYQGRRHCKECRRQAVRRMRARRRTL